MLLVICDFFLYINVQLGGKYYEDAVAFSNKPSIWWIIKTTEIAL